MSQATTPPPPLDRPAEPPDFPYGWRFVPRTRADGSTELEQVPLTLEDVLHPQEEDVIPMRSLHEIECGYLTAVLRSRDLGPPVVRITADLRIDWGVPGLRPHSPDVGAFVGLRQEPDLNEGTFHLADSGGRCLMVVEIVSPDRRDNDIVHKVDHYYRAGVPHYVVVDQEREGGPRQLVGFRPGAGKYEREPLDAQGQLQLPEVGLRLGLRDGRLVCWDLNTGKELGDPASAYREVEEAARELEKADRTIQEQAHALEEAELVRRDALEQARQAKEQTRLEVERARQAEEQARQANARVQELEELLRKLQKTTPGESP